MYCHLVSDAVPVTEEVSFNLPLPIPAVTVGVLGWGGFVGNADAVASTVEVEQPLSLYAL